MMTDGGAIGYNHMGCPSEVVVVPPTLGIGCFTWIRMWYDPMRNFVHTAFKAYCGVILGPVWSATCDIGINTINSLVNVVKFAMDDWFN